MLTPSGLRGRATRPALLGACLALVMLASAAPVLADCEGIPTPDDAAAVSGRTFVGVFRRVESPGGGPDVKHHWTVQRVYAGHIPLGAFSYDAGVCQQAEYTPGERYLVSSGKFWNAWYTVAYRILGDGTIRLVGFQGATPADLPAELRVSTMEKALAVLLLPATDTVAVADGRGTLDAALGVAGAIGLALWFRRGRRALGPTP